MIITTPKSRVYSVQARKKFGHGVTYGQRIYSKFLYGEEEPILGVGQYGYRDFGTEHYADILAPFGIYKVIKINGEQVVAKHEFYIPANPQTESQQANRSKLADAVAEWKSLTIEQKEVYNQRARYKDLSGYNLCLREYLLSN